MIGAEAVPEWLKASEVLQGFGDKPRLQMKEYRLYVEEGLLKGVDDPAAAMKIRVPCGALLPGRNVAQRVGPGLGDVVERLRARVRAGAALFGCPVSPVAHAAAGGAETGRRC
jgi:ribosomal protein L16/L10AE